MQKAFPALLEGSASVTMHPSQSAYWLERNANIEEELRHQQEILEMMIQQMDKRFEEMRQDMNRRFAVIQWMIGIGFTVMVVVMPAVFKYI